MIKIASSSYLIPHPEAWKSMKSVSKIEFSDYGTWLKELHENIKDSLIIVLFIEDLFPNILEMGIEQDKSDDFLTIFSEALKKRLNNSKESTIIAFSCWQLENEISSSRHEKDSSKFCNKLTNTLYSFNKDTKSLYTINLDHTFAKIGMLSAFEPRNFYAAHCRLSLTGLQNLSETLSKVFLRTKNAARKVLVLDCDNTLWGGVIAEDGLEGIKLGSDGIGHAYADFQSTILGWNNKGILLTLCSKNNDNEVWEVFEKHHAMKIKKDLITASRINWKEKASNIISLSAELELSLTSFVFWDDNPIEREKIRIQLPEVETIDVPEDVTLWPGYIKGLDSFSSFELTDEDKTKTEQYKNRASFKSSKANHLDENAFLNSINMQIKKLKVNETTVIRAEQLCSKTNQFNLATKRYEAKDIKEMEKNKNNVLWLIELKDNFGDHGIIGFVAAKILENVMFIDSFMLSCRILGRKVENWILSNFMNQAKSKNCDLIVAEFIASDKNAIVRDFLKNFGMKELDEMILDKYPVIKSNLQNNIKKNNIYIAELKKFKIPNIGYFNEIR